MSFPCVHKYSEMRQSTRKSRVVFFVFSGCYIFLHKWTVVKTKRQRKNKKTPINCQWALLLAKRSTSAKQCMLLFRQCSWRWSKTLIENYTFVQHSKHGNNFKTRLCVGWRTWWLKLKSQYANHGIFNMCQNEQSINIYYRQNRQGSNFTKYSYVFFRDNEFNHCVTKTRQQQ